MLHQYSQTTLVPPQGLLHLQPWVFFYWVYSTRHEFPLTEQASNPIRWYLVDPQTQCHYCNSRHILPACLVLYFIDTEGHRHFSSPINLHCSFQHYESKLEGRKLPVPFQLAFSVSCEQSIQCLQQQGLVTSFWWATKQNSKHLRCFCCLWGLPEQQGNKKVSCIWHWNLL